NLRNTAFRAACASHFRVTTLTQHELPTCVSSTENERRPTEQRDRRHPEEDGMKKKIMFGLATIAALALPALAQAQDRGDRYRDRDRDRVQVIQTYVRPR